MNTIRTAIQIVDAFSPALKTLNSGLNDVSRSFASANKTMSTPPDLTGYAVAQLKFGKLSRTIDLTGKKAREASNGQNQFNRSMREGGGIAGELAGKLKGLVGAYLSFQGIKSGLALSDDLTNMKARIDLMNDGKQSTAELMQMIKNSANATYSSFKDTADLVSQLGIVAKDVFDGNNTKMIETAEQLNKHMVIAGVKGQQAASVMLQFQQALAKNKFQGDEFKSLATNLPSLGNAIADYLGVTREQLSKLATEGVLTGEIIVDAMAHAAKETNKKFNQMPNTFGDIWNLFLNEAFNAFNRVSTKITEITNNDEFKNFMLVLGESCSIFAEIAVGALDTVVWMTDKLVKGFELVKQNVDILAPVIGGALGIIAAKYLALGGAIAFAKIQTVAHAVASFIETIALFAMEVASHGAAAGFRALAAAMSTNPIMLVVYAVTVLIALFYLAIAIVNKFCGTTISATGLIAGAVMGLYAIIYNMIAGVWNFLAIFIEFWLNCFTNFTYSIKTLFVNLALRVIDSMLVISEQWDDVVTGMVNTMKEGINWILDGWNWVVDALGAVGEKMGLGKATHFEASMSVTDDLSGYKKDLEAMIADKPSNYITVPRMETKNLGEYAQKGYDWGKNLENKIKNFSFKEWFSKFTGGDLLNELSSQMGVNPEKMAGDLAKKKKEAEDLAKKGKGGKGGKNKVSDAFRKKNPELAKKMDEILAKQDAGNKSLRDISGDTEDIAYMREIGEREAINRFTTAELKINTTNNNTVNSALDLDGIVDSLTNKIAEAISVTAEGVHV